MMPCPVLTNSRTRRKLKAESAAAANEVMDVDGGDTQGSQVPSHVRGAPDG
jgi:hypothetical protein